MSVVDMYKCIPGGIILIVPSFSFLGTIIQNWTKNSFFIKMGKHVFIQSNKPKATQGIINNFEYAVESGHTAVFIGIR